MKKSNNILNILFVNDGINILIIQTFHKVTNYLKKFKSRYRPVTTGVTSHWRYRPVTTGVTSHWRKVVVYRYFGLYYEFFPTQ